MCAVGDGADTSPSPTFNSKALEERADGNSAQS